MMRQTLDSFLSSLISLLYLLLLFLLPLLMWTSASEVFEFPKMLFVYAMTTLIAACWIGRMIVNKKIIYEKTSLDIPIYLFLLSQLVSTYFSIEPHTSWFGYYSRFNGGLLSTISYTLLYFAYTSNLRKGVAQAGSTPSARRESLSEDVGRGAATRQDPVVTAILIPATLVAAYAILQRLGIDKNFWIQDVVNRVFSTQGQPNWLASYIVMVIPLTWAALINNPQKTINKSFICYLSLVIVFLLALFFTHSRSGLIGFAVADITFWGLALWVRGPKAKGQGLREERLKKPFLFVHFSLFFLLLVTNNSARKFLLNRQSSLHPLSLSLQPSLTKSELGGTESGDIRQLVWSGAIQLTKERPLFGFGPETFAYTYWHVRPIAHNLTSEWKFLYNKAHNEWLNLSANTGLFGLGTHLLLLGWFTMWTIRQLHSSQEVQNNSSISTNYYLLTTALLSAVLGVEAVNFFGFSTVTTQVYTYLFMGIAVVGGRSQKEKGGRDESQFMIHDSRIPFIGYLSFVIVLLVALYFLSQLFFLFFADLSYSRGRQLSNGGYLIDAEGPLRQSVQLAPDEPVFRSELAENEGMLALSVEAVSASDSQGHSQSRSVSLTTDDARKLSDESIRNFAIILKENPVSLSFLKTASRTIFSLGSVDASLYDRGMDLMREAQALSPTDPQLPYSLGVMFEAMDKMGDAKSEYQKALGLRPDYEEAKKALENGGNSK